MLVDFNHAQALAIIFVQQGLDAGGFPGAGISEEEHIVAGQPFDERLSILDQFLFLDFIANQIVQHDPVGIIDGQEFYAVLQMPDSESAVQSEHAYTVGSVKVGDDLEDFLRVGGFFNLSADCLDLFAHILVVHPLFFLNGTIMADGREAVDAKGFLDGGEIEIEQFLEDGKIPLCEMVDAAVVGPHLLAGHAEGIFIREEDEGQVIMP